MKKMFLGLLALNLLSIFLSVKFMSSLISHSRNVLTNSCTRGVFDKLKTVVMEIFFVINIKKKIFEIKIFE